jgi:hypothetical protein
MNLSRLGKVRRYVEAFSDWANQDTHKSLGPQKTPTSR